MADDRRPEKRSVGASRARPAGAAATASGGRRPVAGGFSFGSPGLFMALAAVLVGVVVVAAVLAFRDDPIETERVQTGGTPTTAAPATSPSTVATRAAEACTRPQDIPAAPGKPTDVPVPDKPVTELAVRDLKPGSGRQATDGAKLTMQYVGVSCTSGRQFDASWDSGKAFEFTLGAGEVIPGWDQGIKGMRVGGRRLLWIPASLAYGEQSPSPDIAANDTLIFVVDLQKVA